MNKSPAIDIISAARCTGCGACEPVCPTDAISMKLAADGFYVPAISDACTVCGLCQRPCPDLVEPTQPIRYPVVVPARLRQYQHSALGAATSAASEFKPVKFQVPKTFAG